MCTLEKAAGDVLNNWGPAHVWNPNNQSRVLAAAEVNQQMGGRPLSFKLKKNNNDYKTQKT